MKHLHSSSFPLLPLTAILIAATAIFHPASAGESAKKIQAVATTGMVADLVRQVGGDRVEVTQLMGPGLDPHQYKPTSADASRLGRADVIFYNGLMLEGRMGDFFTRLARSGKKVYAISESIPEEKLLEPEEYEGHHDPHIWFDVNLWSQTVPAIVQGLSETDPEGRAAYEANGKATQERLQKLDLWCKERIGEIPEGNRILVTSHDAYNYFGKAYGFQVVGLQGVSTVSEAALADIASLVDFIKEQNVGAIFVETSVNPAAIQRVAADAGVKIGGELFSDSLGEPGEIREGFDVGTYEGAVRHNVNSITSALKQK